MEEEIKNEQVVEETPATKEEPKLEYDNTPVECTPKKKMNKFAKGVIIAVGSLVGLLVTVWAGLNVLKFPIYHDFYATKEDVCDIPGLNSGSTPQGCTYDEIRDSIYTTSYVKSGRSIIYTVHNGEVLEHELTKNGEDFHGHVGGIATSGNLAYIANDDRVYTITTEELANPDLKTIDIGDGVKVNNQASFIFSDDVHVYVGEFHKDGTQYLTDHPFDKNHAIVTEYMKEDFDLSSTSCTPVRIISIKDEVQGFCVTPEGKYVLSTSYGLASSHFTIYDPEALVLSSVEVKNNPGYNYYTFNETKDNTRVVLAPAMMEDLDIKGDRVITLTEAGSNTYIFGKFFFAKHVISLKF